MTVKCFLLLSSLGLVLNAQAQDCNRPPVPPNMTLKDSDILLETFPEGTRVGYACSVGYMSVGGSPVSVCAQGTWSPVALKCERKNCGSAGEVLNGNVDYPQGSTEFGDTAVIKCDTGFRLVGRNVLNCGAEGWMGRLPECEVVACDPPPEIQDGKYSPVKESYEYREVVRYTCDRDLTLGGSLTRSCSENGTFTPEAPACSNVECVKPDIANAQRVGGYKPTYKYRDTVRHECQTGYKTIGESTSVCELNGQWAPELMKCDPKNCSKPVGGADMSLEDKDIVSQIFLHDSSATFVCNDGYEPERGSAVIKCTLGEWSPLTLSCKPKSCPKPVGGADMSLEKSSVSQLFPHDTSATFVCNDGYEPESGTAVIKCTLGVWSPLTLKCKTKSCSKPVGGADMSLVGAAGSQLFPHDTSATFSCNDGYQSAGGSADIKCTLGEWSPVTLRCKKTTPDKEGSGGDQDNKGNGGSTTGRDVGIAVVVAFSKAPVKMRQQMKESLFHSRSKHSSPVGPTLLDVKMSD